MERPAWLASARGGKRGAGGGTPGPPWEGLREGGWLAPPLQLGFWGVRGHRCWGIQRWGGVPGGRHPPPSPPVPAPRCCRALRVGAKRGGSPCFSWGPATPMSPRGHPGVPWGQTAVVAAPSPGRASLVKDRCHRVPWGCPLVPRSPLVPRCPLLSPRADGCALPGRSQRTDRPLHQAADGEDTDEEAGEAMALLFFWGGGSGGGCPVSPAGSGCAVRPARPFPGAPSSPPPPPPPAPRADSVSCSP